MRLGVLISGSLHALLIAYAIVTLPSVFDDAAVPTIIPVELLEIGDETDIMAKRDVPEPEEEQEEPPAQEEEPEPEKLAQKEPEPEPEPEEVVEEDVEIIPEEKEEPEEKEVAEAPPPPPAPKYVPRVKPKPPPKKEEFSLDNIAALLDKLPDEEEPRRDPQGVPMDASPEEEDLPERGIGRQTSLTLSEEDAFRVQMAKCWSMPAGAAYAEDLVVTFRMKMNPDGTLASDPKMVRNSRFSLATNAFYRTAAESAQRAIVRCQPYKLPPEKYRGSDGWNEMILTFDPRTALGR